jgi:hypothetical protein
MEVAAGEPYPPPRFEQLRPGGAEAKMLLHCLAEDPLARPRRLEELEERLDAVRDEAAKDAQARSGIPAAPEPPIGPSGPLAEGARPVVSGAQPS